MFSPKKVMSLIIVITMAVTLSATAFAFNPAADVQGTAYEQAASTLGSLNIMVGDAGTGNFRPNDSIKRSEFAKVAVAELGLSDVATTSAGATAFSDVAADNWATGYINVATAQKLIIGYPDGTFKPDDTISFTDAVTILVRAMGYEQSAMAKGGYPTGYLVVGSDTGLTQDITGDTTKPAIRGMVAQLAYNALTINLMEQTTFGVDPVFSVTTNTILSEKLNVQKQYGQVAANAYTSLTSSSSLLNDQVSIGGTIYKVGSTNAKNLVGYNVIYYSKVDKNTNDNMLISCLPDSAKTTTKTIIDTNISAVTDTANGKQVSYWNNKDTDINTQNADIASDAILLFNGKAIPFDNAKLTPAEGNITLLDTNNDGKYEIVYVTSYENYVVEDTSTLSHSISDKYGKPSLVLDPNNSNIKFGIMKDGKSITLSDLNEWDVLSVMKSTDGNLINIVVNSDKVTGKVTEVSSDKRVINDKEYQIAANYPNQININDEGTFLLDIEGKIAAVNNATTASDNYAYLVDAAATGSIDNSIQVKLFTKEGETKVLTAADKVKLDDTTGMLPADMLAALKPGGVIQTQLVTYEVNSNNQLTAIRRANDLSAAPLSVDINNFTKNVVASAVYKANASKLGNVLVDNKTIVFDIPAGKTDPVDFAVRNASMFTDKNTYDIVAYDVQENLAAKVLIVTNSNGATSAETPIAVVEKLTNVQNSDNTTVQKLYAIQSGKEVAVAAKDSSTLVKNGGQPLVAGDIIQYTLNAKGEIDKVAVLLDIATKGTSSYQTPAQDLETVVGTVAKKFSDSINVNVAGQPLQNYNIANAQFVSFDSTKSDTPVTISSAGDIQKFDAADPRYVFLRIYKDQVKEVVIIR